MRTTSERGKASSKKVEGLLDVAVEDAKVGLLQVGNEIAELIFNGDGKDHEIGIDANFGALVSGLAGCA